MNLMNPSPRSSRTNDTVVNIFHIPMYVAKYFPENITQFICHLLCLAIAHDSLSIKEFTCWKNPGTLYKGREQTRPECSHGAASLFFTLETSIVPTPGMPGCPFWSSKMCKGLGKI